MKGVKLKKIILDVDGKEIVLPVATARLLYVNLRGLFGEKRSVSPVKREQIELRNKSSEVGWTDGDL